MNIKNRIQLTAVIILCWLVWLPSIYAQDTSTTKKKIRISSDPNQVVIRLDIRFPEPAKPPRGNPLASDAKSKSTDDGQKTTGDKKDTTQDPPTKTGDKGDKKDDNKFQSDQQTRSNLADPPDKIGGQQNLQAADKKKDVSQKTVSKQPSILKQETGNPKDGRQQTVVKPVIIPRRALVSTQPNEPLIEVYADGRVRCGRISANANTATSRLSEDQMQNLLDYIINEHKFYELSPAQIDEKINNEKRIDKRNFARYTFTVITEDENGKKKERQLSEAGIRSIARFFPKDEYLQHLAAIDRRLNQLFITINVGGRDNMLAILKTVNAELKKNDAEAPPFTINDATFVAVRQDGNTRMTFGKSGYDENGNEKFRYVATFQKFKGRSNVYVFGANR